MYHKYTPVYHNLWIARSPLSIRTLTLSWSSWLEDDRSSLENRLVGQLNSNAVKYECISIGHVCEEEWVWLNHI